MNHAPALLLVVVAACNDGGTPAPRGQAPARAREPVAQVELAALEAELGPLPDAPPADEELCDRVRGLLQTMTGQDEALRRLAREELASLGPAAEAFTARWLTDRGAPTVERMAAVQCLGEADTRSGAEVLLERIELARVEVDDETWMRAHCAWRLASGTQDWVVPRLLLHLRYEVDHETVIWMAHTLAHFGNFAGIDGLTVITRTAKTQELRDAAAAKLGELAAAAGFSDSVDLQRAWLDGDPGGRLPQAAFSRAHELEVWRRVAAFSEWQLRGVDDSRFLLQRECSRVAELLARALSDENRYVRTHAAQVLESLGPRGQAAGPALLAALDDAEISSQVALSLGSVRYEPAESALVACLDPSRALDLRVAAARGLGKLGLASSTAALERFAAEGEPLDLRVHAACARILCSAADAPRPIVDLVLQHFDAGQVESGGPEIALDAWLAARAASSETARATLERWRATLPGDPRQRVAERAALLRDASAELWQP